MTRLTFGATVDSLTLRPVTSSLVRTSKDGNVQIILLLYGSHYNIPMSGILQQDTNDAVEYYFLSFFDEIFPKGNA